MAAVALPVSHPDARVGLANGGVMVELDKEPESTGKERKGRSGKRTARDVPDAVVRLWALRALDELNACPMKAKPPSRVRLGRLLAAGGEPIPCAGGSDLCDRSTCPVKAMRASAEGAGPAWGGKLCRSVDRFGERLGLDQIERGILAILVLAESDRRMMDLFFALGPTKLRHGNVILAVMLACTRDQVRRALTEGGALADLGIVERVHGNGSPHGRHGPHPIIDLDRLEEEERAMFSREDPDGPDPSCDEDEDDEDDDDDGESGCGCHCEDDDDDDDEEGPGIDDVPGENDDPF